MRYCCFPLILFSWCSGYHIRLTRGRSPVRSRAKAKYFFPYSETQQNLAFWITNWKCSTQFWNKTIMNREGARWLTEVLTNTMSIWHCTADPTFFGVLKKKEVWVFGGQRYLRILEGLFILTFFLQSEYHFQRVFNNWRNVFFWFHKISFEKSEF